MRIHHLLPVLAIFAFYCAPKPTEKVDLSKTRGSFQLASGGSISDPVADDLSPVLVAKPDGSVVLVFISDRTPCGNCTPGNFHIFVAESLGPIYRDQDGPVFPAFLDPVAVDYAGSSVVVNPGTNLSASYNADKLEIYANIGGLISYIQIDAASLAIGSAIGVTSSSNTNYDADFLLTANHREFMPITSNGIDAYEAPFASAATGNLFSNFRIASADSIAHVPSIFTGFLDSYFVAESGRLFVGTSADDFGEHEEFNQALDAEGLYLSGISVHRSMFHSADVVVFSAYEYATGQHDLFAVTSHDASTLWLLTFIFGYDFQFNPGPYRIFASNTTVNGALNGFNSLNGADLFCYTDSARPDINVFYNAMLVDSTSRVATTTGTDSTGQVDWVLQPNTAYIRGSDGTSLGATDSFGFLNLAGLPTGGLANSSVTVMTGLNTNWTTLNTCASWSNSSTGNASGGTANATSTAAISGAAPACASATSHLYCVEQP